MRIMIGFHRVIVRIKCDDYIKTKNTYSGPQSPKRTASSTSL